MSKLPLIPYVPEKHLNSLSDLLTQIEAYDHNGDDTSVAFLRDMLTWPNYEPVNDCWVVVHPDRPITLIGYGSTYAQLPTRCYGYVAVHPDFRRQGLGGQLLANVVERTQQRGARHLAIDANKHNPAANGFLKKHRFQTAGHSWVMRREAGQAVSSPQWPDGFTIRRYPEFEDPQLLADALNSFEDRWGHGQNERPTTAESAETSFLKYYNPEGVFTAFAPNGSAAGYVSIQFNEKEDETGQFLDVLDAPGVVFQHRHLNLQTQLVQAALQYQQSHSQNSVELQSWGDPPETAALYNDLGFETTAHFISYLKEV